MTVVSIQPKGSGATPAVARPFVSFEIKRRLKLWVVLQDGVYCSSHPEEAGAEAAARRQIQAIEKSGGTAGVSVADAPPTRPVL